VPFRRAVNYIFYLLGSYAALASSYLLTFRRNLWWHTRRNQISSFNETDESI